MADSWLDRYIDFVQRVVPKPKNPKHYNDHMILVAVIAQLPLLIPMVIGDRIVRLVRKKSKKKDC